MLSESYFMPRQNPLKFTIKEDSKDEGRDKSVNSWFAFSKSSRDVEVIWKRPGKIQIGQREHGTVGLHTTLKNMSQEELENSHELDTKLMSMNTESMNYWLG